MIDRFKLRRIEQLKGSKSLAAAVVTPQSWDDETNSCEVAFYTGAAVRRYSYDEGEFMLSFALTGGDFGRYNAGAAVLKDHNDFSSAFQIGKVMEGSARVEGGACKCRVQFTRDPAQAAFVEDVKTGIRKNWSMGVEIAAFAYLSKAGIAGATATHVQATAWEPVELSIVTIPADRGAQTLSDKERIPMDPEEIERLKAEAKAQGAREEQERRRLADERKTQIVGLHPLLTNFGHTDGKSFCEKLAADESLTVADARVKVQDEAVKLGTDTQINGRPRVQLGASNDGKLGKIIAKGLAIKLGATGIKLTDEEEAAMPVLSGRRMCEDALRKAGVRFERLSDEQISQRAFEICDTRAALHRFQDTYNKRERLGEIGASDLPTLFGAAGQLVLFDSMQQAKTTYRLWCGLVRMGDFRSIQMIDHSSFPALEEIPESGVPKEGTVAESAETLTLKEKGRKLKFSRRALINDRWDFIGGIYRAYGYRVEVQRNYDAYACFQANPTLTADGKTVYHADHGNVGTAGPMSAETIGELRKLVREQKTVADKEGKTLRLNQPIAVLVYGSALEMKAEKLFSGQFQATTAADVMPKSLGTLALCADAEVTSETAYTAFANPSANPCFVETVLGDEGVLADLTYCEDSKGVDLSVRLAYNFQAVSHRGTARNVGA